MLLQEVLDASVALEKQLVDVIASCVKDFDLLALCDKKLEFLEHKLPKSCLFSPMTGTQSIIEAS